MPACNMDPTKNRVLGSPTALQNNPSTQILVKYTDSYKELDPSLKGSKNPVFIPASSGGSSEDSDVFCPKKKIPNQISRTQWITVAILTFVNLINYMDRYTIAGILRQVQDEYQIEDGQAGALQTAFVISYMLFAPLFGYFGDRHSRKLIMSIGVMIWVVATLAGSFMPDYNSFLAMRAIVGIGEASYSTIAPTIISDLFVKETRSKMLAIFYFAIPVGSGLGYVVGRGLSMAFDGDWHWALRGTPVLGLLAVFLIIFVMKEPPRGEAEGHEELKATNYKKDLKSLACNMSFVLSTFGFTCVSFCTGALAWWGPKYIEDAIYSMELDESDRPISVDSVSLIFGAVTMVSGMLGVPLGALLSTCLRERFPRSDPLICGFGLILSAVFIFANFFYARTNIFFGFAFIFLGEVALNLNWSIVADILLYVVVPTRRGTAEALQILISHLLGDAGSPYLIGVISQSLKSGIVDPDKYCSELTDPNIIVRNATASTRCDIYVSYHSMQFALIGNVIVEIIGGLLFFLAAIFVIRDRLRVHQYLAKHSENQRHEKEVMMNVEDDSLTTEGDEDFQIPELVLPTEEFKNPQHSGSLSKV